ncbi:MAG: helix-turn-helix transcriptional regulator [Clostridia bacterium]|nr:helix-turn-helix transcriptional regulator [Clostridia bacterium]
MLVSNVNSIIDIKEYGKIKIKLAEIMDKKGITRNKMRSLTGVKYEVVDRYYKAENVERVDLDFLAKACFVLDCQISDLLEYQNK